MRSGKNLLWLSIVITVLASMLMAGTSTASPATTVYVDPYFNGVEVGGSFSVDINVSDVVDLYAYQFTLNYPPYLSKLVPVGCASEGPFLRQGGETAFVCNIDHFSGQITVVGMLIGSVLGVSGDGTLATITFKCVAPGDCILDLEDTTLLDSNLVEIPHTADDGYAYNGLPATVNSFTPTTWKITAHPDIHVTIADPAPNTIDSTTIRLWHTGPNFVEEASWNAGGAVGLAIFDGSDVLADLIDGTGLYTFTVTFEDTGGTQYLVKGTIIVIACKP